MGKRYWLRGGMIGLIVGALLIAIYLISYKFLNTEILNYFVIIGLPGYFLTYLLGCKFFNTSWGGVPVAPLYCDSLQAFVTIATALIAYIVFGILIGWLYGKIKNIKTTA